ncbi:MAG: glycosyltransferase [Planctomycetota bacterium]
MKHADPPAVSVLMPAYNALPYLPEAVESVLNQNFRDFEFLVVNDGSTDGTGAVLDDYAAADPRVRVIHRENGGYTSALNLLIDQTRGEFVARMDADDIAWPDRFEKQVTFLQEHPQVVAVGGAVWTIDSDGDRISPGRRASDHHEILAGLLGEPSHSGHMYHPTVMMRSKSLRAVGGYDPAMEPAEDLDLWLRLADTGRLANLSEIVLDYRFHFSSVSSTRRNRQRAAAERAVRAARERRGLGWPPPVGWRGRTASESGQRARIVRLASKAGQWETAHKHLAVILDKSNSDSSVSRWERLELQVRVASPWARQLLDSVSRGRRGLSRAARAVVRRVL